MRRIKGAKSLFATGNEQIMNYNRDELIKILQDKRYHSPEHSETDEENPSNKRRIYVYNPSWRSKEV